MGGVTYCVRTLRELLKAWVEQGERVESAIMVFASVVVDILNRYLRPYVKKLDPSQIKLGVWKGEAATGVGTDTL